MARFANLRILVCALFALAAIGSSSLNCHASFDEVMLELSMYENDFAHSNTVFQGGKETVLKSLVNDDVGDDYDDYRPDKFDIKQESELLEEPIVKMAEPGPNLAKLIVEDYCDQKLDACPILKSDETVTAELSPYMKKKQEKENNFWYRITGNMKTNVSGLKFYIDLARRYYSYYRSFSEFSKLNPTLVGSEPVKKRMLRVFLQLDEELFAQLVEYRRKKLIAENAPNNSGWLSTVVVNEYSLEDMTHLFRVLSNVMTKLEEEFQYFRGLKNAKQVKVEEQTGLDEDAELELLKKEAIERGAIVVSLSDEDKQRMKVSEQRVKRILGKTVTNFAKGHLKAFVTIVVLSALGTFLTLLPHNLVLAMVCSKFIVSSEGLFIPYYFTKTIKKAFIGTVTNFVFTKSFHAPAATSTLEGQFDHMMHGINNDLDKTIVKLVTMFRTNILV